MIWWFSLWCLPHLTNRYWRAFSETLMLTQRVPFICYRTCQEASCGWLIGNTQPNGSTLSACAGCPRPRPTFHQVSILFKNWPKENILFLHLYSYRDAYKESVKVTYIVKGKAHQQYSGAGPWSEKSTDGSCGRKLHLPSQGPTRLGLRWTLLVHTVVEEMLPTLVS